MDGAKGWIVVGLLTLIATVETLRFLGFRQIAAGK